MDNLTLWIIIGGVIMILFLFVLFFVYVLRLVRKEQLQKKIALMHAEQIAQPISEKKSKKVKK